MAKSSDKPKNEHKLTPAEQKKLADSLALWKATYADVLSVWGETTQVQRDAYLSNSPLLAEMLDWSAQWQR